MKLGDLVRYLDPVEARRQGLNKPGVVLKIYDKIPYTPGCPNRDMVDVLFSHVIVSDDSYEFEVISEAR